MERPFDVGLVEADLGARADAAGSVALVDLDDQVDTCDLVGGVRSRAEAADVCAGDDAVSALQGLEPYRGLAALRGDSLAADNGGMLAKRVGLTVTATGFAVALAAIFGRRPAVMRGAR